MPPWPPPTMRTKGCLATPSSALSCSRRSSQLFLSGSTPWSVPHSRVRPAFSSKPFSSCSVVRSVQALPSRRRRCPMPRPTAVSKVNHSCPWTAKFEGFTLERTAASIAFTSARPSKVLRVQVKATRSRQKPPGSKRLAAASMSLLASAAANLSSQRCGVKRLFLDDGECFDLDEEVRVREPAHLHRGAGRQRRAEVAHAHLDVPEELLDVGDVGGGAHEVLEARAGRGEREAQVLAHLRDLRPHVALLHDVALAVAREKARDENERAALHRHHRRIERMAGDGPLEQRVRLDLPDFH